MNPDVSLLNLLKYFMCFNKKGRKGTQSSVPFNELAMTNGGERHFKALQRPNLPSNKASVRKREDIC